MSQEVREDYLESLEELTVNSRPIIKTLTELAEENVGDAPAVVDAIETHTLHCPPPQKLPALYLVDSVCKNVGEPYTGLFAPRIARVFAAAFAVAPEPVRMKMSELFKTWTPPQPPANAPLFPHDVLRQMNDFMQAQAVPAAPGAPAPAPAPVRPRLNQSALMVVVNRLVQQFEQDEPDAFTERQLALLRRIESRVSGVVDPRTLPQLHQEVEEIRESRLRHQARPPSRGSRGGRGRGRKERAGGGGAGGDKITGTNNVPLGSRKRSALDGIDLGKLALSLDSVKRQRPNAAFSGVFVPGWDLATAAAKDPDAELVEQLYARNLPLQCSTCAYRFHDTPEGRAAKEAEMDWHFRANKDMMEGHSRNRCWFLTVTAWVAYREEDEVLGVGSELAAANTGGDDDGSTAAAADLEAERARYIPVPADSDAHCPVCQEPHETSWSEEAENWVWMNAIEVDGHFFHATCYADPQNRDIVESILATKQEATEQNENTAELKQEAAELKQEATEAAEHKQEAAEHEQEAAV